MQYVIVIAIVVAAAAFVVLRTIRSIRGGCADGSCSCSGAGDASLDRLGRGRDLVQLSVDGGGRSSTPDRRDG